MVHGTKGMGVGWIVGRLILDARVAHHKAVEAHNATLARIGYKLDLFLVAWLEAHGGGGRDVEVHAEGGITIEFEVAIDLEEVEVRANLNWAIARVAHLESDALAEAVILQIVRSKDHRAHGNTLLRGIARLLGVELGAE